MPKAERSAPWTLLFYNLIMTASGQQPSLSNKLFTVEELADLLRVSKSSIYRMVEKRVIAFYRTQSGLRFRAFDVEAYLDSCRREAIRHEHAYGSTKN